MGASVEARRLALRDNADGNDVREGVRKLLEDLHRVGLRGTGGVYFVPDSAPNAEYSLKAMRAYIKALRPWITGKLSPSCNIVRLHGEEAEHLREEIIESATEEFKRRLSDLADKVDPILHGRVNGRTADKIAFAATEDLLKIQSAVAAYAAALRQLRDQVTAQFVARAEMVEAVLTALAAGEHVFVYGPPGTAKSSVLRSLDAFESARDKEPWQMTRDEFFATHRPFSDGAQQHTLLQLIVNHEFDVVPRGGAEEVSHAILERAVEYLDRLRETLVQIALAEGKPVPSEVLREFPDLVAAQRKRGASPSALAANDSTALDQPDEHLDEVAADASNSPQSTPVDAVASEKTPAKNPRKKAPMAAIPALDIPAVWHEPVDFGIVVEGEEALVHYDGRDNIGFDHGSLWFEFRGPTISSTGYRSHFANLMAQVSVA